MRQLGCRFCLQQVSSIVRSNMVERLASHDISLACVSLGKVHQMEGWLESTGFKGELYVDDSSDGNPTTALSSTQSKPYAAFRLKRSLSSLRLDNPQAQEYAKKVAEEFPDNDEMADKDENGEVTIWPGDVFQTGGVFVLGPGNVCDFAYRSNHAGDHPDLNLIFSYATGVDNTGNEIVYESTKNWFNWMRNDKRVMTVRGRVVSNSGLEGALIKYALPIVLSPYSVSFGLGFAARFGSRRSEGAISAATWGLSAAVLFASARKLARVVYARMKSASDNTKYIDAVADVKLLTPLDVDRRVLESGLPECDCGETMSEMPMLGLREPHEAQPRKGALTRARSETWSSEIDSSNEYQTLLCYVREFLAKPHPAVGRGGPVCPFVPTSLKKNSIYMSVIRTSALVETPRPMEDPSAKEEKIRQILARLLQDFIPVFTGLEPSKGRLRQFKAAILIFPDVEPSKAHDIIDEVQVRVKELFVAQGLMVGEFHAANNASGLRNKDFFPLRTPYPCLAIRHMVPGDFVFMTLDDYPLELRAKLLRGFLDVFENEDKPQVKEAKVKYKETMEMLGRTGG